MKNTVTPMIQQYLAIKKNYPDCLLLYRMGDFYELFFDDAHIGAHVLNITLTGKANGNGGRIPMAGVPYHAVDSYLAKLIKAGYKVAVCEQLSPPNKKGLVERDVVRVVTPGTMLDEKALHKKENNYIISIALDGKKLGLATADLSTGYFTTTEFVTDNLEQLLRDELARILPTECILSEKTYEAMTLVKVLTKQNNLNIYPFAAWDTYADNATTYLKDHFRVADLRGFGIAEKPLALQSAASLLGYLKTTQKNPVNHIKKIITPTTDEHMALDQSTILNLELFSTIREHTLRGSLLSILDETQTAMGGRLLRQWMRKPLITKEQITTRHEAVEELVSEREKRKTLREQLQKIADIERLISRLSVYSGNARDIVNLKTSLEETLVIKNLLQASSSSLLQKLVNNIDPTIQESINLIEKTFVAEPPISITEGGMIREEIDTELDRLRERVDGSKNWIEELERKERKTTGITSLKVRFNKVFGFYIEISKSNLHAVPAYYQRKQTLVNGERFITPELKEHEEIILTAEETINQIERRIYMNTIETLLNKIIILQEAANALAYLDCLTNFAHLAEKNMYTRPLLNTSNTIEITAARHPVVEKLLDETKQFVPNDITLDNNQQLLLITGPNMAGKSVFIRQIALLVLMNQIGSFIPAKEASLCITDRIFVRSGASDVITSGLSTFMVEMVETAYIIHHATANSLIVMDEIGRGTSTYDGISIAWAIAEQLVSQNDHPPKTLFATHYHELQSLETDYPKQIKNYHMSVMNEQDAPVFLYTLVPGGASHSFGVAVAKLAGIPEHVIKRANEILDLLEKRADNTFEKPLTPQKDLLENLNSQGMNLMDHFITQELHTIDIAQITPLEALNILAELKDKLKLIESQDKEFLKAD